MKKLLFPILILLCVLAFYFFNGEREAPPDKKGVVLKEATLYHYFSGPLSGGINEMLEQINRQQETTRVVAHALDHEAFKSMIKEAMTGDQAPDLFSYWAGAKTQAMADRRLLEPIDDLWESLSLDDRFSVPLTKAASTYNGRKYLLPITQHIVVFFYNRTVFENAGIEPPADWKQFLQICEKLKQKGITPFAIGARERWPAQFWFDYLLLRTAGPEYRAALMNGRKAYTDPEVMEVYKTWSSMISAGYFNEDANDKDWAEATEMVCRGDAAATLMGTWAIQMLTGDTCGMKAGTDFDYFTFPLIAAGVPRVSVGPVDGIVMTRGTGHRSVASKVMAYASEENPQKLMSAGSGALAPSRKVSAQFYTPFKQRLLKEIQATEYWAFNYDLATPPEVAEKGMDSFNELLAFPGEYKEILSYLQEASAELFTKTAGNREGNQPFLNGTPP